MGERRMDQVESDPQSQLFARCKTLGIEIEQSELGTTVVYLKNGRNTRRQIVSRERAILLLDIGPENLMYLGDYDACFFKNDGVIEASVETRGYQKFWLRDIPGAQVIPDESESRSTQGSLFEEVLVDPPGDDWRRSNSRLWSVDFEPNGDEVLSVALGSTSKRFSKFAERARIYPPIPPARRDYRPRRHTFPTLRISGVTAQTHDEALRILERVAEAAFFELDLTYELCVRLWKPRRPLRDEEGVAEFDQAPRMPRYNYPEKPLSLYWFGRISGEFPLIEYLAYYQVLEYFFPTFSHLGTLAKLRSELRDPRFRPEDDGSLIRILALASGAGRGFGSEREQLSATVAACVTPEQVRDLISSDAELRDHFSGKQKIKSVTQINLSDARSDLLAAVANRVYDIRCRIVHTKENDGVSHGEMLMPFSKESENLAPDVRLVKFLAQKVLISQAKSFTP
ncbi:hypothetical protein [Streptomyces sp. NPDC058955]|uniref:hypothetical protein n=1 Tax=unclassified Streptomyces TaxID=2593676 RepID=UPI00364941C3